MANRRILAKLLLEPLGVSLKMLEDFVIRCHEYGSHLEHQLPKMYSTTTLVRSSHEQYAICRKFDRPVLFQRASSGSFRVDQGLLLSTLYTSSSLPKTTYTFDNYSSQAVSDEKDRAHLSLCYCLAKELLGTHGSSTFVNLLFKHRSEIKVFA